MDACLDLLADILQESVKKNGEKPLTNKWLMNIVLMAIEERNRREDDEMKGLPGDFPHSDWYKD